MATNQETFQNRTLNFKQAAVDAGDALYDGNKRTDGRQACPAFFIGNDNDMSPAQLTTRMGGSVLVSTPDDDGAKKYFYTGNSGVIRRTATGLQIKTSKPNDSATNGWVPTFPIAYSPKL